MDLRKKSKDNFEKKKKMVLKFYQGKQSISSFKNDSCSESRHSGSCYNPSYSGDGDGEDHSLRPVQAKS
jgi:hypothetical protein